MKIRVVSSKNEINSLKESEDFIHLAFRPLNMDILNLIQICPNLKIIHIPKSYGKTISLSNQLFLEMQNIAFLIGDVWGHRKDINEYYEIKPKVFARINKLKDEGKSNSEIINLLSIETKLSDDLIQYLICT